MCLDDTRVTEVVFFWGVTSRSHSCDSVPGETLLSSLGPLNMGKAGSAEMLVYVYLTTWRHIPKKKTVFRILVNCGSIKFHVC